MSSKKIEITCSGSKSLPIDDLKDFQGNLKTLPKAELEKLKRSIVNHGFSFPVFVWKKNILDGHQRIFATKKLLKEGYAIDDIPVVEIQAKDKKHAAQKLLLLNSRFADFTEDGISAFIKDFEFELPDIEDISLPDFEIEDFFGNDGDDEGLTDPDDIPEAPEEPITKTGELWILGNHRLMCGDSTNEADVKHLMNNKKIDLIFTSPPYDNQRNYNIKTKIDWNSLISGVFKNIIPTNDCQILVNLGLIHKNNEVHQYWNYLIDFMKKEGWRFFGWYIWDKLNAMPGDHNGRLKIRHEWIFHFNKKSKKLNKILPCKRANEPDNNRTMRRKDGTLRKFNDKVIHEYKVIESVICNAPYKIRENINHPAMFPIDLVDKIITTFPNKIIYEPFSGSGTTIISAEKNDCSCYGMEISPEYCDIAVKRWEDYTGKKAQLE